MQINPPLIEFLSIACPSIQYRIKSELLHHSTNSSEMESLQEAILQDQLVKSVFCSQTNEGWFGPRFHGYNSFESGIRILVEKGVSQEHSSLLRAMDALEKDTERIARDLGSFGRYFDEQRMGGARMIQAWLLALGGRLDQRLVKEQVTVALEGMQSVLKVADFNEAVEIRRNRLVFRPGFQWPGIYHLRLLACTQSWRTPENKEMIANSIDRMVKISPIPYVHVIKSSQMIAPASFAMLDFSPELKTLDDPGWMMWFHRIELLARMGALQNNNLLNHQVEFLKNTLLENSGFLTLPLKHNYFKQWGAYTGLMLEPDWKTSTRRICDLTFRCYLIMNLIDQWSNTYDSKPYLGC